MKVLFRYLFTLARRSEGANAPAPPRALKCFERDFKEKLFQKFSLNSTKALKAPRPARDA